MKKSRIRETIYVERLKNASMRNPEEKLLAAIRLSNFCFKLRQAALKKKAC